MTKHTKWYRHTGSFARDKKKNETNRPTASERNECARIESNKRKWNWYTRQSTNRHIIRRNRFVLSDGNGWPLLLVCIQWSLDVANNTTFPQLMFRMMRIYSTKHSGHLINVNDFPDGSSNRKRKKRLRIYWCLSILAISMHMKWTHHCAHSTDPYEYWMLNSGAHTCAETSISDANRCLFGIFEPFAWRMKLFSAKVSSFVKKIWENYLPNKGEKINILAASRSYHIVYKWRR